MSNLFNLPSAMQAKAPISAPLIPNLTKKKFVVGKPVELQRLCIDCSTILQNEYNGDGHFAWGCSPTPDGSMINIRLFADGLHGKYGWQVETSEIQQETGRKQKLQRIGGEIIERYSLDNKRRPSENTLDRDTRGEVKPDIS